MLTFCGHTPSCQHASCSLAPRAVGPFFVLYFPFFFPSSIFCSSCLTRHVPRARQHNCKTIAPFFIPFSHAEPVAPGGQAQRPVTWWQGAPGGQAQRPAQPFPKEPGRQAAGKRATCECPAWISVLLNARKAPETKGQLLPPVSAVLSHTWP